MRSAPPVGPARQDEFVAADGVVSDEQGTLALPGVPAPLLRATPSRLAAFVDCPRRYRMTYLDRPPPPRGPAWAHHSLGAAVHLALARVWNEPLRRRNSLVAGNLLDAAWQQDGFRDDAQSVRWRGRARAWVERCVGGWDSTAEPAGIERTVAAKTAVLALSGRIDRLDDRHGELVVVDYKTGRHDPTPEDARSSSALALYAYAVSSTLRRPCRSVELHGVRTGAVAAYRHTDESLARQVRRADNVGIDILRATATLASGAAVGAAVDAFDDAFPAAPSALCGWCDHRAHCAEGRQASAARAPWAGLGEPAEEDLGR